MADHRGEGIEDRRVRRARRREGKVASSQISTVIAKIVVPAFQERLRPGREPDATERGRGSL